LTTRNKEQREYINKLLAGIGIAAVLAIVVQLDLYLQEDFVPESSHANLQKASPEMMTIVTSRLLASP
jgi:hypothetical protein